MSDIYHIPNDDGLLYRLNKFVEYQHEVPSIHYRFVGEYCRRHNFNADEIVYAAFLLSATYSEITTVYLLEALKEHAPEEIWSRKQDLNFGSARKYVKNNDQFVELMKEWEQETGGRYYQFILQENSADGEQTYNKIHNKLCRMKGVGRFAADTFLETIIYMKDDLKVNVSQPTVLDWKRCANLTSGIFNIFYEDERANAYDKTRRLTESDKRYLTGHLQVIQAAIKNAYPDQNAEIGMFIGKICSFRNLFKNARYGGFHHDRELGVLRGYERAFPDQKLLWEECYAIREKIYPARFLGEKNGWTGIRKERKKIWLTTGKTGVE